MMKVQELVLYPKGLYCHRFVPTFQALINFLILGVNLSFPNQKLMFYPNSTAHLISKHEFSMGGLKEFTLSKPLLPPGSVHTGHGTHTALES